MRMYIYIGLLGCFLLLAEHVLDGYFQRNKFPMCFTLDDSTTNRIPRGMNTYCFEIRNLVC